MADEEDYEIKPQGDIDCDYTEDIVCPWCGYKHEHGDIEVKDKHLWGDEPIETECSHCNRPFKVYCSCTIDYTSYRDEVALKKQEEDEAHRLANPRPPPQPIEELTHEEWIAEGKKLFGDRRSDWRFRCPICGNTYTADELQKTYQTLNQCDWLTALEETQGMIGFTCMGRISDTEGCDYTLGGLFQIAPRRVTALNGKQYPVFAFATEDLKVPHRKAF